MWIRSSSLPGWVRWYLCCSGRPAQTGCPPMPLEALVHLQLWDAHGKIPSHCATLSFLKTLLAYPERGMNCECCWEKTSWKDLTIPSMWICMINTCARHCSQPHVPVISIPRQLALCRSHLSDISGSLHCQSSNSECPMTVTTTTTICYLTGSTSSAYNDHDWDQGSVSKWQLHAWLHGTSSTADTISCCCTAFFFWRSESTFALCSVSTDDGQGTMELMLACRG